MLKRIATCLCILLGPAVVFSSHADQNSASRVELRSDSSQTVNAGKVTFTFQLIDHQTNAAVTDADLMMMNERILHLFAYDPALKEFQHVHPEYDGKHWSVDLNFAVNGNYWIWSQGELMNGNEDFSSSTRLLVQDGQDAWPAPPKLSDVRMGSDGISTAQLDDTQLVAGEMSMLMVTLGRNDGSQPENTPYLGAFAHVVATPLEGDSLTHVHPMDGDTPNVGMVHMMFPTAGFYRVWIQFMDGGQLRVVPLAVEVH